MAMDEDRGSVRSVERALDILLAFTEQRELGLTEVAKAVGLHKSTVFRLLHTLERKGFVVRDPDTDRYRLGFRIFELAASMNHSDDPLAIVLPEMERLRDAVEETVSLYIRDGLERIRVQAVQSNQVIRRVAPIGQRLPLFVGASSKVLVAFSPSDVLEALLEHPDWPAGVDKAAFRREIDDVRRKGYAMSFEEREEGVAAVSIPVFRPNGDIFAALTVSGPVQRLSRRRMEEMLPELLASGRRMEKLVR